ncbi:MAG: chromosome partitioning protein [Thermobifida sp.]|uniref:conjugal transfer protein n=1 Tax=Thermobifida sp. TaxID=2027107 RepID=UPI00257B29F7|nr:conjugal transfer protein [Thermobifida sp.]MBO2529624.1 chromosome partitioning protein [Thermobifida sp.]
MDLPTYTRIWRIEKRLYKLYDFRLPVPVSLVTIGVFVGTSVVWCLLMGLLGVPFHTPWHVVWLVPPGVITFLATRPVIEGKSLTELLRSQLVYATEARVYTRLVPQYEPDRIIVTARVWRRDPAAGPLPGLGRTTIRHTEPETEVLEASAREDHSEPAATPDGAPAASPTPTPAHHEPEERRSAQPPLFRRVLNYFGFALPENPPARQEEPAPAPLASSTAAARRAELAPRKNRDDAPAFRTGRDTGDTATGNDDHPSTAAETVAVPAGDTQPEPQDSDAHAREPDAAATRDEEERRAAEERAATRRRAEEIMAAPEPEPTLAAESAPAPNTEPDAEPTSTADVPTQPSRADDFADHAAEPAHRKAKRRLRGRAQSHVIARRMQRARARAEAHEAQAAAHPTPTEEPQTRSEDIRAAAEPVVRGTAEPALQTGQGTALPAPAEEPRPQRRSNRPRPHAAPWDLPPVARTSDTGVPAPKPSPAPSPWEEPRDTADVSAAEDAAVVPAEPAVPAEPDPQADSGTPEDTGPEPAPAAPSPTAADSDEPAAWEEDVSATLPSLAEQIRAAGSGKPRLEIDHGTGELDSFVDAVRPRRGEEESAASRGGEQPEPVQQAGERSAGRSASGKPRLEIDHGTGELDSFVDAVRPRRTEEELAAIEQAALRSRGFTDPAERTTPADGDNRDPLPRRHSNRLARGVRSAGQAPQRTPDTEPEPTTTGSDTDRGLFTRFVDNARKVGGILTPARGTSTPDQHTDEAEKRPAPSKPDLQLDHGTGEQQHFTGATPPRGGTSAGTKPASLKDASGTRGWRRLARVVTGGHSANAKPQLSPAEMERLRKPLAGSRGVVVLGCTGGAGQTITTLMLGHTLAAYRDDHVVAVDINPGPESLSRRIRTETPETLTSLLANTDALHAYSTLRDYTSRTPSGLEVVATLDDPYVQTLDDRDYVTLTGTLRRHYQIILLDPAATGVARALPVVDGLVLVAPASADAARSVALTFEWLDGHGYTDLRSRSIVVINGVSRRSLTDVDAAEQVARGNCRAIVRIPWDDHIASAQSVIEVRSLRHTTRRAYAALAAVVADHLSHTGHQRSETAAPTPLRRPTSAQEESR